MRKGLLSTGLASIVFAAGCVAPKQITNCDGIKEFAVPEKLLESKLYRVDGFQLFVEDIRNIESYGLTNFNSLIDRYFDCSNNAIHVPYVAKKDKQGYFLPSFNILGELIWNLAQPENTDSARIYSPDNYAIPDELLPTRVYQADSFNIKVEDIRDIRRWGVINWEMVINGRCDDETRTIHVPYSTNAFNGNFIPSFEKIGHESFHLDDIGDRWHCGNHPDCKEGCYCCEE